MSPEGNALSRNPNMCASCSSMSDGMGERVRAEATPAAAKLPKARELSPTSDAEKLDAILSTKGKG
jgi:hypothetical protein